MTYQTRPRKSVRGAFVAILESASLGVPVYERLPYEGVDSRSIVLTIVSGTSNSPGIGLQKEATKRGYELRYRLQLDCYSERETVDDLADKAEQAIVDNLDNLETGHDIHHLRKVMDSDGVPAGEGSRLGRILLEFTFYTHRDLTA